MRHLKWCLFLATLSPVLAFASSEANHADPLTFVLLGVTSIFFFAILGRYVAIRLHQPRVLGELLMGVLIGNLFYYYGFQVIILLREGSTTFDIVSEMLKGVSLIQAVNTVMPDSSYAQQVIDALNAPHGPDYLKIAYVVDIFSRYGVIFLLFMVGLETSVADLKHTGRDSFFVAALGIAAPMLLGFVMAKILIPQDSYPAALFIGATLSATSIGITARVLAEMKKLHTREAKTILGAAMLDDVLGLIILAVVSSVVLNGTVEVMPIIQIIAAALIFFIGSLLIGPYILKKSAHVLRFFEPWEAKLFISFLFIMTLSWFASFIGLASIIGAFTAGIILHDGYFTKNESNQKTNRTIYHLLSPIETILAPTFFVLIGIQVKLESFCHWNVIILALGLIFAAVIGKLISGLGANNKSDRLLIGIGMLPRGEVGLVFASIGRTLGVISDDLFSAIVLMVIITTVIAPPLLKARYKRRKEGMVNE